MTLLIDVLLIISLFTIFAVSHSFLAAFKIKKRIADKIGNKIAFYRMFYNLSSIMVLYLFYEIAPRPNIIVYDLHFPFDIFIFVLQFISLMGIIWAGSYIEIGEFFGTNQIKRYFAGNYSLEDYDEHQVLVFKGPFKFMRHPIYFFSILFLGLRPAMDLFYLVFFLIIVIYFYVGSIYEEKKLVERFGVKYGQYQKIVPRIVPLLFYKKKSTEE